jgi:hypothetical protein
VNAFLNKAENWFDITDTAIRAVRRCSSLSSLQSVEILHNGLAITVL